MLIQFKFEITFKSSPLKPLNQIKPNLVRMVPWWVPFKIVSVSAVLYPNGAITNYFFTEKPGINVTTHWHVAAVKI
jgi:hypothetical protein